VKLISSREQVSLLKSSWDGAKAADERNLRGPHAEDGLTSGADQPELPSRTTGLVTARRTSRSTRVAACVMLVLISSVAFAHKGSDAYWGLSAEGSTLRGQLDLSLRDLDAAHGLDTNGDGAITWNELSSKDAALQAWVRAGVAVAQGTQPCPLELGALSVIRHSDGAYATWPVTVRCPSDVTSVSATYRLLFDVDAQHRGLLRAGGGEWVAFSQAETTRTLDVTPPPRSRQVGTAFLEGLHHISIGWDHLCFLFALLLPSVLRRDGRSWVAKETLRGTLLEVTQVVTAFTVAHSITLALAAFGVLAPNPAFVEVAIAVSVVLAALNTVFPVVTEGRWTLAFGLGLLHGFGFVSALADLGASGGALWASVLGFNLGVEAGQLSIVACFVPLAFLVRARRWYTRGVVPVGGVALVLLATWWTVERVSSL
jgi:hypothetical protein